jgi:aconitate hydratase
VIARSFARIHEQNLVNFGILPVTFSEASDYEQVDPGDILKISELEASLQRGRTVKVLNTKRNTVFNVQHALSKRQIEVLLSGGLINWMKWRLQDA